jgi:hypothetical protein
MGLLSYLNPLRPRLSVENDDYSLDEDEDETPSKQPPTVAQSLSARGHQVGIFTFLFLVMVLTAISRWIKI